MRLKIIIISLVFLFTTGCSAFSLVASGSGIALTQNSYMRAYNTIDFGVVLTTKKGIKTHLYEKGKKYVYDKAHGFLTKRGGFR